MATGKPIPWSVGEVRVFLCLVADEGIQRELDGATRNEKVYQEVSMMMAAHGYRRTFRQCREKLKKLKSDYRSIKDHGGRRGSNRHRKRWKWFDQMDAIYGRRPASSGREGGLMEDNLAVLREMHAADAAQLELNLAQRERHFQLAMEDAVRARELEAALRREENAATAAFNQAFLATLNQLVQVLGSRRDPAPPPLD